ncbi:MAG: NAD(+)/NADH kinase [Parcubacteria group bacterium]|nr:NAD(+)/NADH kinase [Parcubacteria group bacterium]
MKRKIKTLSIFYRKDTARAKEWHGKIAAWLKEKHPRVRMTDKNSDALIVLGGDGTILEAVQKYQKKTKLFLGLNLGHTGFLASVREPKLFLSSLNLFLQGKYRIVKRMTVEASVWRKNKNIFSASSLNEISVQSLLGMVEIEASIDGHIVQHIRGTGALVATATGSTAYNLSAHGPIVMPDIKCMILTEIMDHNIPTPSIVIKRDREVELKIISFRKDGLLTIATTNEPADVVIAADGGKIFSLEQGDVIKIRRAPRLVTFAEIEPNYFFKSLQEKFAFK